MTDINRQEIIWKYHKSQGRDAENPPVVLGEARNRDRWVQVWVTGMDTVEWFYALESQAGAPRLIALNLNTQSDQGLLIGDALLTDCIGQRKMPRERWQRFTQERLTAMTK